ncbi:MAG: hypothetical protein AAF401_09245 [Pseudomonadota bacterium]
MSQKKTDIAPKTPFSAKGRDALRVRSRFYRIALILSVIWLACLVAYAAGFFGLLSEDVLAPRPAAALEIALFALAAVAPVAFFFYGALLSQKAEEIRAETARLSSAIDALRHSVAPRAMPAANELADALTVAARTTLAEEKAALAAGLSRLDGALAETQTMMDTLHQRESEAKRAAKKTAPKNEAADADQPVLPFGGDTEIAPVGGEIAWVDVVRALNFPNDENDEPGFAALRRVVTDRDFADLLQAAEDVLSLLSEEGLYMEDVHPEIAPALTWRNYAQGARGKEVETIGGVVDEVALALARSKMRTDPVFRDTSLHFLRRFDKLIERVFGELGEDPLMLEIADTRTGRAFMVIARVMGVFDQRN